MTSAAAQPDPARTQSSDGSPEPSAVRQSALVMLSTAAAVAALGIPLGLLWAVIAPDVPVRVTSGGPVFVEAQPQEVAAGDAWFAVLSVPFGVLAAVGAWLLVRRLRGAGGLVTVIAGAVLAGVLAWWLGRQVGLAGYEAALENASAGAVLDRPGDLRVVRTGWWPPLVTGVPLVPALAAGVTYTLLAAWSRFPDLIPDRSQRVGAPDG